MTPQPSFPRLGAYLLPGRVSDPTLAIGQARAADFLGLGTVWLSERWGTKDVTVLAGAVSQCTSNVRIATGVTHFGVRHPVIVASAAMTMQALSGGRFVLGVGRSVDALFTAIGQKPMTGKVMADSADIVRRLCRGEKVRYDGPAGKFPVLKLQDVPDVPPPPLVLAAIGPKTLALGGAHFDGVILHPFLTPAAVSASGAIVRKAAEEAGRDPADVKIYATVVVAPDLTDVEEAAVVGGRAVTYFQIPGFGEQLAGVNNWPTEPLTTLRNAPLLANVRGAADSAFRREELIDVGRLLPREWIESSSATGTAAECAAKLGEYLDAGADELVLHGSTPELLGPLLQHVGDQRSGS